MLFNSAVYIFLLLPLAILLYFLFNRFKWILAAKIWLIGCSLFFYGYWNPNYLVLIVGSLLTNFFLARWMLHINKRENRLAMVPLVIGIVFNIALLGYFKYANFLVDTINQAVGLEVSITEIALPLAISFFTFQQIAYLVDCYKKTCQEYSFVNYCLFVTFFPQLIAGPIVHHREMMPQFEALRSKIWQWRHLIAGVTIFIIGLFKKVIIADSFAVWADAGFSAPGQLSMIEAWGASLSYTMQLYYDFSGYTDMAIGTALMFNIHLPSNFNSPYKSLNIQDFWRRWHMTLSRWLRDYIYIPLGGNRGKLLQVYASIFITFLIGGIWHGAGWTFVLWGGLHGTAMLIHRLWQRTKIQLPNILSWLFTFLFINCSWIFFRAESVNDAWLMLTKMCDFSDSNVSFSLAFVDQASALLELELQALLPWRSDAVVSEFSLLAAMLALGMVLYCANSMQIKARLIAGYRYSTATILGLSLMTVISFCFVLGKSSETFLYFNF